MTKGIPLRGTLAGFSTLDQPLRWADVLVIGSGIAGMTVALEASRYGTVLLISKSRMDESNTRWAQGDIAAALDGTEEAYRTHIEDTLVAGAGLCDEAIVETVVREGPDGIRKLMDWGAEFDRDDEGELALCLEAGHAKPRILHADGDATGAEISRALVAAVQSRKQIRIMERVFTIDLLVEDGECHGALVWDDLRGKQVILARSTVLATGGCGRVYRETTNPAIATGDGLAMAFRAGAKIMDAEFVQFHPTTLYVAGASRSLISEAVRGEGAWLVDREGRRFMEGIHPDLELAPRDVVARAITSVMEATRDTHVFLDLSAVESDVTARFPGIARLCRGYGLDLARDRIPVRPSAHYMIGGVRTDAYGATSINRLYAAGEVACTGLHGANRLASNSLLEGLVFGLRVGRVAGESATGRVGEISTIDLAAEKRARTHPDLDLDDMRASMGSLMWREVGIVRSAEGLARALSQIEFWAGYVLTAEMAGPRGWELQNLLTVAWLITDRALAREESRGAHYRSDFPDKVEPAEHSVTERPA